MYGALAVITRLAVLHLTLALSRYCYAINLCERAWPWRALKFCNIVSRKDFCVCVFILVFHFIYVCCIILYAIEFSCTDIFPLGSRRGWGTFERRWGSVVVEECGVYGFHLLCQTPFGIFTHCGIKVLSWPFEIILVLLTSSNLVFGEFEKAIFQVVAQHSELIFNLLNSPNSDLGEVENAMFQLVER